MESATDSPTTATSDSPTDRKSAKKKKKHKEREEQQEVGEEEMEVKIKQEMEQSFLVENIENRSDNYDSVSHSTTISPKKKTKKIKKEKT